MNALLIDDEPLARAEMRRLLAAHPEIAIIGEAGDADQARAAIQRHTPDLLFLDIQMPEETGFDLLASLGRGVPQVVFTTAYDRHALRAFEFGAIDYLVKPVEPERLALAIARLHSRVGVARETPPAVPPPRLLPEEKVFVRHEDQCWFVPLAAIRGFESDGDSVRVWLADGTPLLHRSLAQLEERLPEDLFFRANRSQLINLRNVERVEPWFSGCLKATLTGGRTVELSRRQSQFFRDKRGL